MQFRGRSVIGNPILHQGDAGMLLFFPKKDFSLQFFEVLRFLKVAASDSTQRLTYAELLTDESMFNEYPLFVPKNLLCLQVTFFKVPCMYSYQ